MQLIYKNEQIELARDDSAITTIFEKVSNLIKEEDTIFSHLVIDDVDIYENHEEYIKSKINEIMRIEIITRTTKEMIWETMESIHEYLQRAIPSLNELVNKSYENFSEEVWNGIEQLTEGMQWMLQFKTYTERMNKQPVNWKAFAKSFEACEQQFAQLLEAVEAGDTVLISDILAYEITPSYEALKENIEKMLEDNNYLNIN